MVVPRKGDPCLARLAVVTLLCLPPISGIRPFPAMVPSGGISANPTSSAPAPSAPEASVTAPETMPPSTGVLKTSKPIRNASHPVSLVKSNLVTKDGIVVLTGVDEAISLDNDDSGTFLRLPKSGDSPEGSGASAARLALSLCRTDEEGYSVSDYPPLSLGKLKPEAEWMSLARMKLWWLAPFWGRGSGTEIPPETSFVLVRIPNENAGKGVCSCGPPCTYCLMLPLSGETVRACVSGAGPHHDKSTEGLLLCIEKWRQPSRRSVNSAKFESAGGQGGTDMVMFVATGADPFQLLQSGFAAVADRLQTFRPLSQKRVPALIDRLGWCTWDAFGTALEADGVVSGVRSLRDLGVRPGFVIIDDGWQNVAADHEADAAEAPDPLEALLKLKEIRKSLTLFLNTSKDSNASALDWEQEAAREQERETNLCTGLLGLDDLCTFLSREDRQLMRNKGLWSGAGKEIHRAMARGITGATEQAAMRGVQTTFYKTWRRLIAALPTNVRQHVLASAQGSGAAWSQRLKGPNSGARFGESCKRLTLQMPAAIPVAPVQPAQPVQPVSPTPNPSAAPPASPLLPGSLAPNDHLIPESARTFKPPTVIASSAAPNPAPALAAAPSFAAPPKVYADVLQQLVEKLKGRDEPSAIDAMGVNQDSDIQVLMWHAVCGYWSGISSRIGRAFDGLVPAAAPLHLPDSMFHIDPSLALAPFVLGGMGIPKGGDVAGSTAGWAKLYETMYSHLEKCGVDGVKVDGQAVLSLMMPPALATSCVHILEEASKRWAKRRGPDGSSGGANWLNCMCHTNLMSYRETALARASDDFWPADPASHTVHIAHCVFNSLFVGEICQPDFDMFQTRHPAATLHAVARALSGGPVYLSDKPGMHDLSIIERLVLPKGLVLRPLHHARPTRDSLFRDVCGDGESVLKVWNRNTHSSVVGVFNLQGAKWDAVERKRIFLNSESASTTPVSAHVSLCDIEMCREAPDAGWVVLCVVFAERRGERVKHLLELPPVTLEGWSGSEGDISVTGSWDGWAGRVALWEGVSGLRECRLDLVSGETYNFKFVISRPGSEDQWVTSSAWAKDADETGNINNILRVGLPGNEIGGERVSAYRLQGHEIFGVSLEAGQCAVATMTPIQRSLSIERERDASSNTWRLCSATPRQLEWAAIGLEHAAYGLMFNPGAAIVSAAWVGDASGSIRIEVMGPGILLVFASRPPSRVSQDGMESFDVVNVVSTFSDDGARTANRVSWAADMRILRVPLLEPLEEVKAQPAHFIATPFHSQSIDKAERIFVVDIQM